jgi:hypothetical protein
MKRRDGRWWVIGEDEFGHNGVVGFDDDDDDDVVCVYVCSLFINYVCVL